MNGKGGSNLTRIYQKFNHFILIHQQEEHKQRELRFFNAPTRIMNERFTVNNKWIIRQPINSAYMMAIHTFVHTNIEISSCITKKHREMFKTPWFVAWFHENEEFFRPALFQDGVMRYELEKFLVEMSDMILLYNFAGYYFVKDMAKWIESNPDNYLTELPFGIIPMRSAVTNGIESRLGRTTTMYGSYAYYTNTFTMKEQIVFECSDPHLESRYSFSVFNNGARFVPMYDGLAPITTAQSSRGELVPVSPFAALYRRKSLIEEAIEDMYDANFSLSHPQTFVTPQHIPDSKVTDISESMYYGADTLNNARHTDSAMKQMHATQSVRWLVDRLNQQVKGGNKAIDDSATRRERKKAHARPDQSDGIHTIAGYVNVTNTHQPSVIVNIDTAQNQYEEEVCNVVGLPYIFYRNDSGITARATGGKSAGGGHSATNEEQLNFYKTVLYDEIDTVFASMNRLFGEVYTQTYRHVDIYTLSSHYAFKEQERMAAKAEREKEKKPPKTKKRKHDEDDTNKCITTIDFDERAKSILSGVHVALKYEKMVTRSTASLTVLLQCFEKGVIGPEYMKKYIHLLYGQEADLIYSQETPKGM